MQIDLTNEQKVLVTVDPVTAAGNPAELDGFPTWEVLSGDVTIEVQEDPISAYIVAGNAGVSQIQVSGDANLGDEVRVISATLDIIVTNAEADNIEFIVGEPEIVTEEDPNEPV